MNPIKIFALCAILCSSFVSAKLGGRQLMEDLSSERKTAISRALKTSKKGSSSKSSSSTKRAKVFEPKQGEGVAQEPELGEGATLEPELGEGAAQEPEEGATLGPELGEGAAQEPELGEGATLEPEPPQADIELLSIAGWAFKIEHEAICGVAIPIDQETEVLCDSDNAWEILPISSERDPWEMFCCPPSQNGLRGCTDLGSQIAESEQASVCNDGPGQYGMIIRTSETAVCCFEKF